MACNKCKDNKCEYRNKGIEEYTITCAEGCTKEIRNEAIKIVNNENFVNLKKDIIKMECTSKSSKIFNNRMAEMIKIATNPLVDI